MIVFFCETNLVDPFKWSTISYAPCLLLRRRIRELGYGGLIVGLTGDTGEHDLRHFKDHGADAVLPKPFNMDHLNEIVRDFMSRNAAVLAGAAGTGAGAASLGVLGASQGKGSKGYEQREGEKVGGSIVGKTDKTPKAGGLSVLAVDDASSTR